MNYNTICRQAKELTLTVGDYIREQKKSAISIEQKGLHNFVTRVDKASEKKLVEGLLKILPEAGFVVEEKTIDKTGDRFNWIIDPIDGTTNYIHGLPPYSISVALQEFDKMVVGIVYEPNLDECFHAFKNSPAFLNDTLIEVSKTATVDDSLIATGFPYSDYGRLTSFMKSLSYFMKNSRGVRRLGSAAVDLVYVACGRFDVFYEYGLNPWDIAAGTFILEQAGGKVTNFDGQIDYLSGKDIIASNKQIHSEFESVLQNIFNA